MAYDQAFFLALAAKGKDEWNKWRHNPVNKPERVTFEGVDFSEAPKDRIDFSGFEFGHHANFSKCKWRGAEWRECEENRETFTFGRACFTSATFGHGARFYGVVFGNGADFSGVKFGHDASFPSALFGLGAFFKDAAFGYRASFDGAAFGNGVSFSGAAFGSEANFNGAAFGGGASFSSAAFGGQANFACTAFGDLASFTGAAFADLATFDRAAFGGQASFASAAFGSQASFEGAAFVSLASFAGVAFGSQASFEGAHFNCVNFIGRSVEQARRILEAIAAEVDEKVEETRVALKKRHEDSWERDNSGPDRFLTISFANARFDGDADFSGRTFERAADFTNALFYRPPDFDAKAAAARIDFTGAYIGFGRPGRFHLTSDTKIPVRLRALRKIAEDTKNHDLERDLYIEERKAERGVYLRVSFEDQRKEPWKNWPLIAARLLAHLLWIIVMGLYWALADYGRSVARPFVWLVSSGFLFYWCYGKVLAPLMAKAPDIEKYKQAVRMLALGNTVPFVGPLTIDSKVKEFLFCPCRNCPDPLIPPEGHQWLVLGQNLFSITCVFFIGLALRNYFRIK